MNLDIQLAWCRHWVREQLGLKPTDSIVLLIRDSRIMPKVWSKHQREVIRSISTQMRWQFSHPCCVLLSVVKSMGQTVSFQEGSLIGVVDEQVAVSSASDLCGWIGAASTLILLHDDSSRGDLAWRQSDSKGHPESIDLLESIIAVSEQFKKPWNSIPLDVQLGTVLEFDWERLHQAQISQRPNQSGNSSVGFSSAVDLIQGCLVGPSREIHGSVENLRSPTRKAG